MFDANGEKTWEAGLDIYGRVRTFAGRSLNECPFRYQGQYEDVETGLYYNRFRYYSLDEGMYISQDPIRLNGGMSLYSYVHDTNSWIDAFGLMEYTFPSNPNKMTEILSVEPKIGVTPDGTSRYTWEPNSNTKIRYESHPNGLNPGDADFNPRHHGNHYHVETKPDGMSWSKAGKTGNITKSKPQGYTQGSGTGFLEGEEFPNAPKKEPKLKCE